jgi:hypothetical protein
MTMYKVDDEVRTIALLQNRAKATLNAEESFLSTLCL